MSVISVQLNFDEMVKKYSNLSGNYHSVPVGVETYGAYGPQAEQQKKNQEANGEKLFFFSIPKYFNGNTKLVGE